MPRATLTLTIPEGNWMRDVSTAYPDLVFRVRSALAGEDAGIGLVELHTDDPLPTIEDVRSRDDVVDVELLWKHEDETLLQVETSDPLLLVPAWRAGVPLRMPFDVRDGEATWKLTTSSRRLSDLGDHLDDLGIPYALDHVGDIDEGPGERVLTARQRELLLAALRAGYYESPRDATLTEVADDVDASKSTVSDVLHRAEGNVVRWFVEEHLAGDAYA